MIFFFIDQNIHCENVGTQKNCLNETGFKNIYSLTLKSFDYLDLYDIVYNCRLQGFDAVWRVW